MRCGQEKGFALLLVFAMAAAIAVLLYSELPRAAFESQRAKEEILIERGEQYTRAIQLYITSFKKYPQSIDDLEKNPRQRFLRRRYLDPMTGKDEWRLIHATNGVVTDSKIKKQDKEKKAENTFITESAAVGSSAPSGSSTGTNMANRRRQSDGAPPAFPGGPGSNPQANPDPNTVQQQQQPQPVQPGQLLPGQQPVPGQQQVSGQPQFPGQQPIPGQQQPAGIRPGGFFPGAPPQQGQQQGQQQNYGQITAGPAIGSLPPPPPQQGQQPGQPAYPQAGGYPTQPGLQQGRQPFPQAPAPGQNPGAPSNPALNLIGQILTTPNPNMNPAANAPQTAGGVMGTGIVGVASKFEGDSIKIYNERQKYDEWEFVYDPQKDPRNKANTPQKGNNLPGGQLPNANPGNSPGTPPPNPSNPGGSTLR